jgi:tripartite ATP-independent transporter DctM subunit
VIGGILDILMIVALCGAILFGFPVAFTLAGVGLAFALVGHFLGVFNINLLWALPPRIFGIMTSEVLIAIPLFVFMGLMLERSKIAEELLENMGRLFGRVRGGLAVSVTLVGALLAASTGIVGATVVTMGLMALPSMIRNGYRPTLACGSIAAAGTLGQIIPPSIVLIILGEVLVAAYQQALFADGQLAAQTISVGQLFAGALIPGLVLVGLYVAYQLALAFLRPDAAPPVRLAEGEATGVTLGALLKVLAPPIILIVAVLGSIIGGIATPTEAAGVGAIGATLLGTYRMKLGRPWPVYLAAISLVGMFLLAQLFDLRIGRFHVAAPQDQAAMVAVTMLFAGFIVGIGTCFLQTLRSGVLREVSQGTLAITCMIFVILIAATIFALVFRGLGGDELIGGLIHAMPGGVTGALIAVMALIFFLGFFLEFVEITIIVIPIVGPILFAMGVDPIWLGILLAVNLQTSFLTPPFGFALFYLRGVAPPQIRTMDIYLGALPFVALQIVGLILFGLFPALSTWLPRLMFG